MNKEYALFDWDNTVRKGYTLFSWVDYLYGRGIIDPESKNKIDEVSVQYDMHSISHDQYAEIACSMYAEALKGLSEKTIHDVLSDYMKYDRKALFANIGTVFQILYDNGIESIVISGAPSIIVSGYAEEFHISKVYAFKEAVCSGVFTGGVEYNYGFDKKAKVLELVQSYGMKPIIAFGDSASDIPMLENAVHPFCVGSSLDNYRQLSITKRNRVRQHDILRIERTLNNQNQKDL